METINHSCYLVTLALSLLSAAISVRAQSDLLFPPWGTRPTSASRRVHEHAEGDCCFEGTVELSSCCAGTRRPCVVRQGLHARLFTQGPVNDIGISFGDCSSGHTTRRWCERGRVDVLSPHIRDPRRRSGALLTAAGCGWAGARARITLPSGSCAQAPVGAGLRLWLPPSEKDVRAPLWALPLASRRSAASVDCTRLC